MSRSVPSGVALSTHASSKTNANTGTGQVLQPTSGHTITVMADYAIWDETSGKFITPEDCKRV